MEGELSLLPRVTWQVNRRAHSRASESIHILRKFFTRRNSELAGLVYIKATMGGYLIWVCKVPFKK